MTTQRTIRRGTAPLARFLIPAVAITLALDGCYEHKLLSVEPCATQGSVGAVEAEVDAVDLLLVLDNSASMADERAALGAELPRLVRVISSGAPDGWPMGELRRPKSLHLGVVTADMGVAGFNVPTCTRAAMVGDDGLLRTAGSTALASCAASYPSFLAYEPSASTRTPEQVGDDFRCVATAGSDGCEFQQPLEAALKALTPSTSPTSFFAGARGHGDRENAGFLRPNSVLAIVLVTDQDDCSVQSGSEDIFDDTSTAFPGDLSLRCFLYRDAQYPVQRYIDGFKALRPGREGQVVFGAFVGVPSDLIPASDAAPVLADPRMFEAMDPVATSPRILPSCDRSGGGPAFPPRRIVEVAQGFGERGMNGLQSICGTSLASGIEAIATRVRVTFDEALCWTSKVPVAWDPAPNHCTVIATIPPPGTFEGQPTSCASLPAVDPEPKRTNADGSIECEVRFVGSAFGGPSGDGWHYQFHAARIAGTCADGDGIALTRGATPPDGVDVRFECLENVEEASGGTDGAIRVGTLCEPGGAGPCDSAGLRCDPVSRTCQIACTTDRDCPSSLVCHTSSSASFCRNPICVD